MLGPVGSSKSTITRLLKKGLERYAATPDGAVYTFGVSEKPVRDRNKSDEQNREMLDNALQGEIEFSPMNVDPLSVIPQSIRASFLSISNDGRGDSDSRVQINGGLDPASRFRIQELMRTYDGDVDKVLDHVVVKRVIVSEEDRTGMTTFQPKDPKGQDTAELTGDINYRKLAEFGVDSDPRAFSFDGELCRANRGIAEFIEVLKLEREFLYELLTATQERMIKPKKFSQTEIDTVLLGHTNEAEYEKLQTDRFQEALRDRSLKIDIPYVLTLKDERRIYEKDFQ